MQQQKYERNRYTVPLFYGGDILGLKYIIENDASKVQFSAVQTYRKQRYFNRCYYLNGNGLDTLIIPVSHNGVFPELHTVKICYKTPWQHQHLKKIYYAYKNAAFFDFLWDRLEPFYMQNQPEFLYEWNAEFYKLILNYLGKTYGGLSWDSIPEIRFPYRLEETPHEVNFSRYFQLFSTEFIPNLSPLDLLMNVSKVDALYYLTKIFTPKEL